MDDPTNTSFIERINGKNIPQWFSKIVLCILGFILSTLSIYTLSSTTDNSEKIKTLEEKTGGQQRLLNERIDNQKNILDRIENKLEKISEFLFKK